MQNSDKYVNIPQSCVTSLEKIENIWSECVYYECKTIILLLLTK